MRVYALTLMCVRCDLSVCVCVCVCVVNPSARAGCDFSVRVHCDLI